MASIACQAARSYPAMHPNSVGRPFLTSAIWQPQTSNPHKRARGAAQPHLTRFRPLEVFGRRPSVRVAMPVMGRHPKTFTLPDSCGAAKEAHLPQALRTERDVSKLIAPRAKAALGSKRSGAPIKLVQGSRISLPLTQVRVRPPAALATGQIHAGKLKRGLGGSALHLRRAPVLVI